MEHAVFEYVQFIWVLFSLPLAWLWFLVNKAHKRVSDLKDALQEHELYGAQNYMHKDDIEKMVTHVIEPVKQATERIERNVELLLSTEMKRK